MSNGKWWTFKEGNSAAGRSADEWVDKFIEMIEWVDDPENEVLRLEAVYLHFGIPKATFFYVAKNNKVAGEIRDTMTDMIKVRISEGALKGDYVPSPSIFILKNLGDVDSSAVNMNHSGAMITEHKVIFEDYTEGGE